MPRRDAFSPDVPRRQAQESEHKPPMLTGGRLLLAALTGGLIALLLFLLVDRWILGPQIAVSLFPPISSVEAERLVDDATIARARIEAKALTDLVETFKLTHKRWPASLNELAALVNGQPSLCTPEKLDDPWGKKWQLEVAGNRIRVFTTTPEGKTVEKVTTVR